jgi:hypothetical protein
MVAELCSFPPIERSTTVRRTLVLFFTLVVSTCLAQTAKADPVALGDSLIAFQNGGFTQINLANNPGANLISTFPVGQFGPIVTVVFGQLVLGIAPPGGTTLTITATQLGVTQTFPILLPQGDVSSNYIFAFEFPDAPFILPDGTFPADSLVTLTVNLNGVTQTYTAHVAKTVPEPATLVLLCTGLAGVGIRARKKLKELQQ